MGAALNKWTTVYDPANMLIIHKFGDRITVSHNKRTDEVRTIKDGEIVDRRKYQKYDFDRYLNRVFADAEKLKEFAQ